MSVFEVRTQVYLTYEQHQLLKQRARREKKTMAELIREALTEYLSLEKEEEFFQKDDPIWKLAGICRSGIRDSSVNHDSYLYGAPKRKR